MKISGIAYGVLLAVSWKFRCTCPAAFQRRSPPSRHATPACVPSSPLRRTAAARRPPARPAPGRRRQMPAGPLCRLCRDLSHADLHVRADRTESLRSQMCVVDRRAAGSAWSSRFRGTTSAVRRLRKFEMQDDPGFAGWSPGSRQGWWRSLPARGRPSGVVQPVNAAELRGRSGVLIRSTSAIWARGE